MSPRELSGPTLHIARRALRLQERISGAAQFDVAPSRDEVANARLTAWRESAAGGDEDAFARRLSWDGLSPSSARNLLVEFAPLSCLDPVPDWVFAIEELCAVLREPGTNVEPFRGVVRRWATRRLLASLAGYAHAAQRLSQDAWIGLCGPLDRRLDAILAPVLARRSRRETTLGMRLLMATVPPRTDNREVMTLDAASVHALFEEHPAIARATVRAVELWVSATVRFLVALEEDREAIGTLIGCDTAGVETLVPVGDPHNGMQMVKILTFSGTGQIVYKPRSLSTDIGFRRLVGPGDPSDPLSVLEHPRVIDRQSHGWMEHVSNAPCASSDEIGDFYHRAGVLLFWLYLLDGADCHFENLIASGAMPVAIDLEVLFSPGMPFDLAADGATPAEVVAADLLQDSVLRTGLLPKWRYDARSGSSYDVSGLSNTLGLKLSSNGWAAAWCNNFASARNRPHFEGQIGGPVGHVDRILRGFSETFKRVEAARNLTSDALEGFTGAQARYVFRDTAIYASVLAACDRTDLRTNGLDRGIALEALAQPFMLDQKKPEDWGVVRSEVAALEDGDIPYFLVPCDGHSLCDATGVLVEKFASEPSLTRVRRRIGHLTTEDLRRQATIIGSAFAICSIDAPHADTALNAKRKRTGGDADFLRHAERIADDLSANAIAGADGSASWIGPMCFPQSNRIEYQVVGANLYDGVCGIASFLAALYRVTAKSVYRDRARASLTSLATVLSSNDQALKKAWASRTGLGGASGIGSIIYGLTICADLLDDGDCLAMARDTVSLVEPGWIEADKRLDLLSGSAGLIHALLGSGCVEAETAGRDLALKCARRLMQMQDESGGWLTIGPSPILGMSHGAAGIALALDRLGRHCQDPAMRSAASRGFAFESALYDPERGTWPDLRPPPSPNVEERPIIVAWCHGATGIALSRLAALRLEAGRDDLLDDAMRGLKATAGIGQTEVDTMCCGNAGRADALMTAGRQLGDPSWTRISTNLMRGVADRYVRRGHFGMFIGISGRMFSPGMFRGTAGIGYTFLRILEPDLPNVLTLDRT